MKGGRFRKICEAGGRHVLQSKQLMSTLSGASTGSGGVRVGKIFVQKGCFAFDDVQSYTRLTGDSNPIHISASAAREAGFDACVVPGMLCGSLFPAIIGSRFSDDGGLQKVVDQLSRLPIAIRAGAVYISQDLKFKAPLLVGELFLAEVEVRTIVKLRQHAKVTFFTRCVRDIEERKTMLVDGDAVALLPISLIGN